MILNYRYTLISKKQVQATKKSMYHLHPSVYRSLFIQINCVNFCAEIAHCNSLQISSFVLLQPMKNDDTSCDIIFSDGSLPANLNLQYGSSTVRIILIVIFNNYYCNVLYIFKKKEW